MQIIAPPVDRNAPKPDAERRGDGKATGLGLLPLRTGFVAAKRLTRVQHRLAGLQGPWAPLAGQVVAGDEVHHGISQPARLTRLTRLRLN